MRSLNGFIVRGFAVVQETWERELYIALALQDMHKARWIADAYKELEEQAEKEKAN